MKLIRVFSLVIVVAVLNFGIVHAQVTYDSTSSEPSLLPIRPNTSFYLTGTPSTHSAGGTQAAIDFQITDDLGFIDKGAPLYAPISGYAKYVVSENGSSLIEITQKDKKWKVMIAHVMSSTSISKEVNSTYPRYVKQGELIGFQGNSGMSGEFAFPVHVHYELAVLEDVKNNEYIYTNDNLKIDICSKLQLKEYCDFIDDSNQVILINEI